MHRIRNTAIGLAAAALVAGTLVGTGPSASADEQDFTADGTFIVPAGVTSVVVNARGAKGGSCDGGLPVSGDPGEVNVTLAVTPGEALDIHVGTPGSNFDGDGAGGANGGGAGSANGRGAGGGGASDVRQGGTGLEHRVVVAGGGGGCQELGGSDGGDAGNPGGGNGGGPFPGEGGGPSAGGLNGDTWAGEGEFGVGGAGANSTDGPGFFGGGAGGGWYGGGGGGSDSSGGGGSSYVDPDVTSGVTYSTPASAARVRVTWTPPPPTTTTTTTEPPTTEPPPTQPPAPVCPKPAIRVFPNRMSLLVAAYLMQNCGYTPRGVDVSGVPSVVIDPPAGSGCPAWQPFRIWPNAASLHIAKYLIDNCFYTVHAQVGGPRIVDFYVVPHSWSLLDLTGRQRPNPRV